jgi:hypothetical protein
MRRPLRIDQPSHGRERAAESPRQPRSQGVVARSCVDWRGWIALAWVVFWGWAYALMAIQARSPQIIQWIRTLARRMASGG